MLDDSDVTKAKDNSSHNYKIRRKKLYWFSDKKNTIELNSLIVDGFKLEKSAFFVRQAWFNYSVTTTLGTMYVAR